MANRPVKGKLTAVRNFCVRGNRTLSWFLPALALLTFISSWAGLFPPGLVERWYAHFLYLKISQIVGRCSDVFPFSWLDLGIPLVLVFSIGLVRRRRFLLLLNVVAVFYLLFFWSWGLNYHRQQLAAKLSFDSERAKGDGIEQFAMRAATQINRLYVDKEVRGFNEQRIRDEAIQRVRRVVQVIDRTDWRAAERIKNSLLVNPWLHIAGIDGLFNPYGHEAIISNTLLDIERPFVIAHELGHVRGYPNEGDANLIALFATVMSSDPYLQYSGWLNLWLYVRTRELDTLLDDGPKADLQRIFARTRTEQIRWVSNTQAAILDWYLKANNVDEGIRSYSQVVMLAVGTEPYWDRFR